MCGGVMPEHWKKLKHPGGTRALRVVEPGNSPDTHVSRIPDELR